MHASIMDTHLKLIYAFVKCYQWSHYNESIDNNNKQEKINNDHFLNTTGHG